VSYVAKQSAAIFGCAGLSLTAEEQYFFREVDPLGFILFARNVKTANQVRLLVDALRDCTGREDALVLIDQEGGRISRLPSPHWRSAPPALNFGVLYQTDPEAACEAAWLNGRLLARDLSGVGINVDCVPVLDLLFPKAHGIIGDRSFGGNPETVSVLGRATCEGLLAGNVLPVIKHVPGHGRATVDSHDELPIVETPREELEATDFQPFRALAGMPLAMTAHVVYSAIDRKEPATTSSTIVDEIIRGYIGFDGLLLSDDLSMRALSGDIATRTRAAMAAGCDVALHCNGELREMTAVTEACGTLSATAVDRHTRALARLGSVEPLEEADVQFEALMSGEAANGG